ncbi:MAG: phosphatidate cytidylyltransferase [bacterium]|nr:phosphatidate cytidylyltransferase [bacterium]
MLFKRVITAAIGIPVLIFIMLSNTLYQIPFLLFVITLNILGHREMIRMFRLKGIKVSTTYSVISGILLILLFYGKPGHIPSFAFSVCIVVYAVILLFRNEYKDFLAQTAFYTFALFYITFLSGHFIALKSAGNGSYYLFMMVLFIWLNDTFAYFSGALFGKKKLFIKASPKKSYAGLAGGMIFSFFSLFLSEIIVRHRINFPLAEKVLIAFLFGLIVTFSDLIESALKRSVGIKDSGTLIPGHGGILDRFDTWFVTLPLFYYYLKLTGRC